MYRSGVGKLEPGVAVPPEKAKDMPEVKWKVEPGKYYFLSMTGNSDVDIHLVGQQTFTHYFVDIYCLTRQYLVIKLQFFIESFMSDNLPMLA